MTYALAAPDLWTAARTMLGRLFCLFGVCTIEAIGALNRQDRAEVLAWLAPLEALVRKLLLIEAAAFVDCPPRRHSSPTRSDARIVNTQARAPSFALAPPHTREKPHPARITLLGRPTTIAELQRERRRDACILRLRTAERARPNVRLTNRIAALARVIAQPLAYARRLARLLKSRAPDMGRHIAEAPSGRRPLLFDDRALAETQARVAALTPPSDRRR